MQIELVVFDMAGTTVAEGGAVYQALRDTLALNGLELPDEAIIEVKGMNKREALKILIEQSSMRDELLPSLDVIHEDFIERMIEHYRNHPAVGEMPGASDTVRWLKSRGIKTALNTGFSRDIAQILIDRLGQQGDAEPNHLIDASVTSDEVEQGRPHPFMIRHLMRQFGINDSQRVAKVGDTPADLLEGHNAACGLVIGVTKGASPREVLLQYPHDHLIGTVAELPGLLEAV